MNWCVGEIRFNCSLFKNSLIYRRHRGWIEWLHTFFLNLFLFSNFSNSPLNLTILQTNYSWYNALAWNKNNRALPSTKKKRFFFLSAISSQVFKPLWGGPWSYLSREGCGRLTWRPPRTSRLPQTLRQIPPICLSLTLETDPDLSTLSNMGNN